MRPPTISRGLSFCATAATSALLAFALPAGAGAQTTIEAKKGSAPEQGWEFGGIYDESDGQVITAPPGVTRLRSFTLWPNQPTSFVFRGFVYAWDGAKATGPELYESADEHTSAGGVFQPFTFETDVPVTPGDQYVIFLSESKDEAADKGFEFGEALGWVTGEGEGPGEEETQPPYTEGGFVALHNEFDPEKWTTQAWYQPYNADAFFTASLASPPAVTSVTPGVATTGSAVAVTGTELENATEVLFGTTPATHLTLGNEHELTAEVPSGVSGTVDVRVITSAGESPAVTADQVTIPAPPPAPPVTSTVPTATFVPSPPPPRPRCVVPYLGGMSVGEVKRTLIAAHCKLGKVVRHYSRHRRGELVEQDRHQTTVAPEGSSVDVWLSLGAHSRRHHAHGARR